MSDLTQAIDAFDRAVLERDLLLAASLLDADSGRLQVEPSVSSLDREGWLAALDLEDVHGYEVLERFIHEDGDTAAVLQQVRLSATVDGQDRMGTQTVSDVWRRRGDGWRLWRRHIAPDEDLAAEQRGSEAAAARAAHARDSGPDNAGPATKATVTEIAAVLATIADAGEDPNALTMQQVEQYVQAFRALKSNF
ncbi:MAG: nuclear transport factor 2 family protein [Actinomycetales bacterium]